MIEQKYLKSILDYDFETGIFKWKVKKSIAISIGDIAGSKNSKGYIKIHIDGKGHSAHRLAWLYMKGELPLDQVDHINRIRNDNRFCNLRVATNKENQENVCIRKDNLSGITGINWRYDLRKWHVRIQRDGKRIHIGFYEKLELAKIARIVAEQKYYTYK